MAILLFVLLAIWVSPWFYLGCLGVTWFYMSLAYYEQQCQNESE